MTDESRPVVYIVEDGAAVRESLQYLVESVGLSARSYESVDAWRRDFDAARAVCIVLDDVRLPGVNGLQALEQFDALGIDFPTIILTAYGTVRTAVRAMRAGAIDVIEKPYEQQELLDRIHECIGKYEDRRRDIARRESVAERLDRLTQRERQVMELLAKGLATKEIARELGISPRTAEVHRARVLKKMETSGPVDLARLFEISRGARPG